MASIGEGQHLALVLAPTPRLALLVELDVIVRELNHIHECLIKGHAVKARKVMQMKQVFMSLLLLVWVLSTAVVIIELWGQPSKDDQQQEGGGPGYRRQTE